MVLCYNAGIIYSKKKKKNTESLNYAKLKAQRKIISKNKFYHLAKENEYIPGGRKICTENKSPSKWSSCSKNNRNFIPRTIWDLRRFCLMQQFLFQ